MVHKIAIIDSYIEDSEIEKLGIDSIEVYSALEGFIQKKKYSSFKKKILFHMVL